MIPQPKPAKILPTQRELDNPCLLIQQGPLEWDELVQIGVDLEPDIPKVEVEQMLASLKEKQGILVPSFWKKSPESFRERMDEELIALSSSTRLPRARQQSRVLEALLRIWRRKFNPNLPIYKIERIQKPKTVLESTLIETIKLHKDKLGLSFTRDPHSLPGSLEYLLLVDVGRLNPDRVGKIGLSDYEEGWTQVELTSEAGYQIVDIFKYVINLWKDGYEVAHPAVIRFLTESDGATLEQQPRLPVEAQTGTEQNGAVEDKAVLPSNIKSKNINTLNFGKSCKELYRDFSEDHAYEILRAIPGAWQEHQSELPAGSWGPRWVEKKLYISVGTISNHLRVLYKLGARKVDGIKLPYHPKISHK